jgi:carboxyl-terminal processing protease
VYVIVTTFAKGEHLETNVNKSLKTILIALAVIVVALASFSGGFFVGHLMPLGGQFSGGPIQVVPQANPTQSAAQETATPQEFQTLFKPFWEAWNLVHQDYVDQPVDDLKLMRGAITGMMESLGDKHSTYMDPQTFTDANADLAGEYEGIGAYVDTTTDYLTVISPIPGSPAEKMGIMPGDKIVKINGEDMTGVQPELARRKVLGPAGSVVKLSIAREGESQLLEFEIKREKIVIKSASGKMLDNNVAYIQITTFGDKTTQELTDTLKELLAKKPTGIIIDLRNNGGGYLQTAVEVTSQFLGKGVVLYEQYGDGKRTQYDVIPGGMATDIPLVVLINEGSASASEITAGALQDTGRAKLVGVTSYGKGSVQNWIPLADNQGAVRITIAKWLTPSGRTIHGKGLTSDVVVELTTEDFKAKRDPQLEVASQALLHFVAGTPYTYEPPQIPPTPLPPQPATETPTKPVVVECPLAMPSQLISTKFAIATTNLNLRSSPEIRDNWLKTIPAGTTVEVLGNPTCNPYLDRAYLWWQVKLPDGTTGWSVEGSLSGNFYFLELKK